MASLRLIERSQRAMPKINLGFITSLALIATAVAVWIALFQGWDSL